MTDLVSSHFSFIVRCWRDTNGILRGLVVDAATQRSYPFASGDEITARIEALAQPPDPDEPVTSETRPAENK